jgi:cytochrome b561
MPVAERSRQTAAHVYSPTARMFHWITAGLVLLTIPIAVVMVGRGEANIWDATTNNLYSAHKGIGFLILLLIIARLTYRLNKGAPPPEPTLTSFERTVSGSVHWLLYALLLMVPIGGWIGVSLYGSRGVFDIVSLPQITPINQDLAGKVLTIHKFAGIAMAALIVAHIGASLFHHFVKKDGVLRRMLPKKSG